MRPQRRYRRLVLRNEASRRMAAALLLTLAFCGYRLCVRAATPAEIESVRMQLHAHAGTTALAAFDTANARQPAPSLLRLHLLRLTHGGE